MTIYGGFSYSILGILVFQDFQYCSMVEFNGNSDLADETIYSWLAFKPGAAAALD